MTEVLRVERATLRREGNAVLIAVDWTVNEGERWVILGPNGAGKTSLLTLAAARAHPSEGAVWVLGERLGTTSVQELGLRVGLASDAVAARIPARELARDVVMTAAHGVTGRWKESYDLVDFDRAGALMAAFGIQDFAGREYRTLSEGERKRVQLARALMTDPEILLLDEPAAGLDLTGREELLEALTELAADPRSPVLILVTHHVEEIPRGFTHALLLGGGRVVAAGALAEVVTAANLTLAYGIPVELTESSGRWTARKKAILP
jgi:iron complex transport system ATP-binding protein